MDQIKEDLDRDERLGVGGEQNQVVHAGSVGCFIRVQRVLTLSS